MSLSQDSIDLRLYTFFFTDTATTEIYTLSLHDALPISQRIGGADAGEQLARLGLVEEESDAHPGVDPHVVLALDRKSTRLNSSHSQISYAVFCLKKKMAESKNGTTRTA